jgi:esterase/lipase
MPYNKLLGIELPEEINGSFFLPGTNDILIYFIPGWSELPKSLQPAAYYLQSLGYSVVVPSYPSFHITTRWTDWWYACWTQLQGITQYGIKKTYLAGFSLGGLFALQAATLKDRLEQECGLQVMGVISISPPLRLKWKPLLPSETIRMSTFDRQIAQQINRIYPTIPFPQSEMCFEKYRGSKKHRPVISIIELIRAIHFTNQMLKRNTLQTPVSILLAENDEIVDNTKTSRIAQKRLSKAVEIKKVPGRHNCLLDQSCKIACEFIHKFISKTQEN